MNRRAVLLAVVVVVAACSGDDDDDTAAPTTTEASTTTTTEAVALYDGYASEVYADDASWLCRPDMDDVCDSELDATVVEADGSTALEPFAPAEDPAIDCFYVYPTISFDATDNSDMIPGEGEELNVARQQAARLGEVCRVFAPVYRSTTLTALTRGLAGGERAGDEAREIAYGDVLDAWKHYIDNDNEGRGVIVIGHSQGAGHLSRLLAEEVDPNEAVLARLVSAMLLGSTAHASRVPNIPVCAADVDTGCLISYSSYRSTAPPPENAFFGWADEGERAVCTNPAALAGGAGDLVPYFEATAGSVLGGGEAPEWGADVSTPFVTLPGLVTAECVERDGYHYLELTVHGDPATPRIDDVRGDLTPEWGMHLIDVNVTMGNLVEVARAQAGAHSSS